MKKYFKLEIKNITLLIMCLSFLSCMEENSFDSDVDKVEPFIFDFSGSSLVNLDDVVEFSVTPRGGATYTWEASGATIQAIEGATHKVNVIFNQVGVSTVSVYEMTANGAISETSIQTVNVLQLCDWTIEMQDAYGDGWNGAQVQITFTGGATIDPITVTLSAGASGSQTFSAPHGYDMTVTYISGDWDEEVTYQIIDASGTEVFSDGTNPVIGEAYTTTVSCP